MMSRTFHPMIDPDKIITGKKLIAGAKEYYTSHGIQLMTKSLIVQGFWSKDILFGHSGRIQKISFDPELKKFSQSQYSILFNKNKMSFFELVDGGYVEPELPILTWEQFIVLINLHLEEHNEEATWIWF
jgi:hypothetical protein